MNLSPRWSSVPWTLAVLACVPPLTHADDPKRPVIVDLSLLVAPEYPATWPAPAFAPFRIDHYLRIGPRGPYNADVLAIDENTGTQFDAPSHSIPPPESRFPTAGPYGRVTADKVPAWQFGGEACVIDCKDLLDSTVRGRSDLLTAAHILAWEKKHRRLGFGDVALFRSGFSDKYYKPLPEGRRFVADPVDGKAPVWPDPDPDCMELLAGRKVMNAATDSPSMGPLPAEMAAATHLAGLKHGMIWTESATGLGKLPDTGAFYCMLPVKHVGGAGSEGRAFAVVGDPLARRLIDSARNKRAVDLTVPLAEGLPVTWPGLAAGDHRHPYFRKVLVTFEQTNGNGFAVGHLMDSHAGTHLVPPAYSLPPKGFDNRSYSPTVREWLKVYESQHGPRGTSAVTTEKVPLDQTMGPARIIDAKALAGSTDRKAWPASPEVTPAHLRDFEKAQGPLQPGDIVILQTGYSNAHFKPLPAGESCLADPLAGKSEGWPALRPDAIAYLASKGIRCVATDAPTLGGVDPRKALTTYWMLGGKGMVGVEFLTNVDQVPKGAYFLFAPVKIRDCHGGPGRAIALY